MTITLIHNFNGSPIQCSNSICSTPGDTQLEHLCYLIFIVSDTWRSQPAKSTIQRHSNGSNKAQRVKNWRPRKINEKNWKFPNVAHADLIRIQPRHLQDLVKVGRPLIFSLAHFYSDYWRRVVNVFGDRVAAAPVPHWPLGWGSTLLLMLEWKIGIIFSTFGPVSTFSSWGNIL